MKTTVVIPNYNGIEYLRNCLLSLKNCEPQDFSVLVVDNGSTDGSVEMLNHDFANIKYMEMGSNTGFAPAVNAGIKAATTPYVLLLNNDTTVHPDFVANLEKAIESSDHIFSVSAKMVAMQDPNVIDGCGDLYCALGWAYATGKGKDSNTTYNNRRNIFSACAGAAIYRRDILEQIGYFDENHFAYLEDVDVGYRAKIAGYRNIFEPTAICLHAGSAFSGSRYNEFKINLSSQNSIYLILKNMPLLQLILNLPLLLIGFMIKILFFAKKGFGGVYVCGLGRGFALYFSKEGHSHKVHFKLRNLINYILIELELLFNIFRRLRS